MLSSSNGPLLFILSHIFKHIHFFFYHLINNLIFHKNKMQYHFIELLYIKVCFKSKTIIRKDLENTDKIHLFT